MVPSPKVATYDLQPEMSANGIKDAIITELAKKARSVVRDINPLNDLTFFRVRSKRQEIMVAPDKALFLIVIQE